MRRRSTGPSRYHGVPASNIDPEDTFARSMPMYHLDQAGFEFDVATLSGNPAKFEWWAFPSEDSGMGSVVGDCDRQGVSGQD